MLVAGVLFASLALSYRVASRHHRPRLADRIVYLAVLIAFLLYPALNQRLLKLYLYVPIGDYWLLDVDKRLHYDELGWYVCCPTKRL